MAYASILFAKRNFLLSHKNFVLLNFFRLHHTVKEHNKFLIAVLSIKNTYSQNFFVSILKTVISAHFHLSLGKANKTIRELYGFLFYLHIEFLMHSTQSSMLRGPDGSHYKINYRMKNFTANDGLRAR